MPSVRRPTRSTAAACASAVPIIALSSTSLAAADLAADAAAHPTAALAAATLFSDLATTSHATASKLASHICHRQQA